MRPAQVCDSREVSESDGIREIGIAEARDSVHLSRSEAGFTQGAANLPGRVDCIGIRRQRPSALSMHRRVSSWFLDRALSASRRRSTTAEIDPALCLILFRGSLSGDGVNIWAD